MSRINLFAVFVFLVAVVQGYYYKWNTNTRYGFDKNRKYYTHTTVNEMIRPSQEQLERWSARRRQRTGGPRRLTQVYQRQGGPAVRTEKGPRRRRPQVEYQVGPPARRTEKGPRRRPTPPPTRVGYQVGPPARRTEKGPRRRQQTGYQVGPPGRRTERVPGRGTAERKGPRRPRPRVQSYQAARRTTRNYRTNPQRQQASGVEYWRNYKGCKDNGRHCIFWKSIGYCRRSLGRDRCQRTCNICEPLKLVCPASYRFGCCWDGTRARDARKSNCRKCRNTSRVCVLRSSIYTKCDLSDAKTMLARKLCPQTCGACTDFLA